MTPKGQLLYFRSPVDGNLHPCAVCATDDSDEPKALILEVSPGAISNLKASVNSTERIAGMARKAGKSAVVLRPMGRGPGTVYQNYGEVDVFEAIQHVSGIFPIDSRRISVTGSSMGGAATWYLASHYPDVFASAVPYCGYCDYTLWEKPGGLTFHMHPWEEPSWQSRSAAYIAENLEHTPVWMVHGEWDRSVGGGVPVDHSRLMNQRLDELGFPHRYTEVPRTGHGCRKDDQFEEAIAWMLDQEKPADPDHVGLATYGLRHNSSYWLGIEQLAVYGSRAGAEAMRSASSLEVVTEGVRTLRLGPMGSGRRELSIDGTALGQTSFEGQKWFRRSEAGGWETSNALPREEKRRGSSGPIGDMFVDGTILVPGTVGEEAAFHNGWVAGNSVGYYRSRNGGVHRGGIEGETFVELPVAKDTEVSDDDLAANNLILYGAPDSNAITTRFAGDLPISFEGDTIYVSNKSWTHPNVSVFAVLPHPLNPDRTVAIHGGVTADAVTWGSHLDMNLLPDYIVYAGGETLDWGFWDNGWQG